MKKLIKVISLVLVAVSVLAIAAPAFAQTGIAVGSYAYTIKGDVAVRSSASSANSNNIINRVNTGTEVKILTSTSTAMGFYKVSISGITSGAYIREDCLGTSTQGWVSDYGTKDFVLSDTYSLQVKHFQEDLAYYFDYINSSQRPTNWTSAGFADGYYGTTTANAVKKFQSIKGLTVDGITGTATKTALWNAVN